jgi:hypothetical protein
MPWEHHSVYMTREGHLVAGWQDSVLRWIGDRAPTSNGIRGSIASSTDGRASAMHLWVDQSAPGTRYEWEVYSIAVDGNQGWAGAVAQELEEGAVPIGFTRGYKHFYLLRNRQRS